MFKELPFTEKVDKFTEYLSSLTKEEIEFIENISNWDNDTRIAFKLAKKLMQESEEEKL